MNVNELYENSDAIIGYVTSKIKSFEPDKFKQQVIYYINDYCNKVFNFVFPQGIINEFYNAFYELFDEGRYVDTNYEVELGQAIFLCTCNFSCEAEIKQALRPILIRKYPKPTQPNPIK